MFIDFVCGFKDKYLLVWLKMRMTLDNLKETQPIRDSSGEVVENNIGDPVIE